MHSFLHLDMNIGLGVSMGISLSTSTSLGWHGIGMDLDKGMCNEVSGTTSSFVHVHMHVYAPCVVGMLDLVAILLFAFKVGCKS